MIGACLALNRARDMLSTTEGSGGDMEAAEYPKERDSIEDSAEMLLALKYDDPLHLEPCLGDEDPPMPTLVRFQHFGSGDAREIFSQAKGKIPAWSGAVITLTGDSMVIGSAESGSDQEQGIDIICRHENIQRFHAVIYYRRRRQCWVLESLGGRCIVGSAQKNWPPYLAEAEATAT